MAISVGAQPITGIKTIGGTNPDYATIASAISALNTNGTAFGGVIFEVAAGHSETALNLTISTPTGSDTSEIIFRKSGIGANPLINAGTGVSTTLDAVIKIAGTDYITFDGIDIFDNPTVNTTNTTRMEWGYAILKANINDGSRNVTIKNCTITLQKTNTASRGIYAANHTATSTSLLNITGALATNSNLNIHNNTIQNCFHGIFITGSTNVLFFDDSIAIGTEGGNFITDFGGSSTAYGIYIQNFRNATIANDSIVLDFTPTTSSTHYGIFTGNASNANVVIENNFIQLSINGTQSTRGVYGIYCLNGNAANNNSIYINNNRLVRFSAAASSTIFSSIYTSSTAHITISNNLIDSFFRVGTSGNTQIIHSSLNAASRNIFGNTIMRIDAAGTSAQLRCINITEGGGNIYDNTILNTNSNATSGITRIMEIVGNSTIYNNNISNITSAGTGANARTIEVVGNSNIFSNIIKNINHPSSSTGTLFIISSSDGNAEIHNNSISNFSTSGSTLVGIELGASSIANEYTIYRNRIYQSSSTNNSCIVSGIRQSGNSTSIIYNNLISGLATGASTTVANGINGINIAGTGAGVSEIYHNNIVLNALSTGGSNCLLLSTSNNITVANNILVNLSGNSTTTTRSACAIRRTSNLYSTYNDESDNNLLYVSTTPTTNRFIYADGTNHFNNINDYKLFAQGKEQLSISNIVNFTSLNGDSLAFLMPLDTAYIESAGKLIATISGDYLSDTSRSNFPLAFQLNGGGLAPDIGAHELDMAFVDILPPAFDYRRVNRSLASGGKMLEPVLIKDVSGVNLTIAPRLYFKKSSNSNTLAASNTQFDNGWKFTNAIINTNDYSFYIDYSLLFPNGAVAAGDTIEYFLVAQDNSNNSNIGVSGAILNNSPSNTILTSASFPATIQNSYRIISNPFPNYVTVGSTNADYPNLTGTGGLFEALNNGIISTDITAVITTNLNNENGIIALNKFFEEGPTSGQNKLIIEPASPNLTFISGTNATSGIINFNNAERVIIDGALSSNNMYLQFTNLATTGNNSVFHIIGTLALGGSKSITIKNCIVHNSNNQNTGSVAISIGGTTIGIGTGNAQSFGTKNINIINNHLYQAYYGILANGSLAVQLDSLNFENNTIGKDSFANTIVNSGIYIRGMKNSYLSKNTIKNIWSNGSTGVYGIVVNADCNNITINANRIDNIRNWALVSVPAYGIYCNTTTVLNLTITNNIISKILAQGGSADFATAPVGIFLNNGNNSIIHNNTISLNGSRLNHSVGNAYSACLYVRSPISGLSVMNNIFRNHMSSENTISPGNNFALATSTNTITAFSTLNHNIYEVGSSTSGMVNALAITGSTLRNDLNIWRSFSGRDLQSFYGNPGLISDSIPFPDTTNVNCWLMNGRGLPSQNVFSDFWGNSRSNSISTGSVDIGAVEFTPGINPPAAQASALPSAGTTTSYTLWGDTIASITWAVGSITPIGFELRYHSGTQPPVTTNNRHFDAYWSFVGAPIMNLNYNITLHYKPESRFGVLNENNITAAKLNPTLGWDATPSANTFLNTANRRITINGLNELDILTGTDMMAPLPVNLLEFNARKQHNSIVLNWKVTDVVNFSHFEVEKLTNYEYQTLSKIIANQSRLISNFSFIDNNPIKTNQYRLKMVDRDGSFVYSPTRIVNFIDNFYEAISIYPNPANTNIYLNNIEEINSLKIANMQGIDVSELTKQNSANRWDISLLPEGIYIVNISLTNGNSTNTRLLITR